MISYSNYQLLDGRITLHQVRAVATFRLIEPADVDDAIANLVASGAWDVAGDDYQIHDYLDYNESGSAIVARRTAISEARQTAGRQGGVRSGETRRRNAQERAAANPIPNEEVMKTKQTTDFASVLLEANAKQTRSPVPTTLVTNVTNVVESDASHEAVTVVTISLFDRYAERLKVETPKPNRQAILEEAHFELFGRHGSYSRLGKIANAHGGAGEVLRAMIRAGADWRGVDDPLDLTEKLLQTRAKGTNGYHRNGTSTVTADDSRYMTSEAALAKRRADAEWERQNVGEVG